MQFRSLLFREDAVRNRDKHEPVKDQAPYEDDRRADVEPAHKQRHYKIGIHDCAPLSGVSSLER